MSVFYSATVHCPMSYETSENQPVKDILDQLGQYGEDTAHNFDHPSRDHQGMLNLSINGYMSSSSPEKVDDLLTELGDHLTEAAVVNYEHDGEKGEFVIGPSQQAITRKLRELEMGRIDTAIKKLSELKVSRQKLAPLRRALRELQACLK